MRSHALEDALAELGIAPGATKAEIRKAYLRLVKTRPPETDPEGFQRLRAAYDALNDARAEESVAPPPGDARGAAETEEGPSAPAPLREARTRDTSAEAAFAEALAPHVGRNWRRVARLVVDEVDGATREGRPCAIDPRDAVALVLRMRVDGAHTDGRNVTRALARSIEAAGGDLRVFGDVFIPWLVARELAAAGAELPATAKGAIAVAALEDDPEQARLGLNEAGASFSPETREAIERSAVFSQLFGQIAAAPHDAPTERGSTAPRPRTWSRLWLVVPVSGFVAALIRLVANTREPPQQRPAYTPPPRETAHTFDSATAAVVDGILTDVSASLVGTALPRDTCRLLERKLEAIDQRTLDAPTRHRFEEITASFRTRCVAH